MKVRTFDNGKVTLIRYEVDNFPYGDPSARFEIWVSGVMEYCGRDWLIPLKEIRGTQAVAR